MTLSLAEELSQQLDVFESSIHVDCLSNVDAGHLLSAVVSLKNRLCALELLLAKRAVDGGIPVLSGARDDAAWLADITGSSVGSARAVLSTASHLTSLPDVAAELSSGSLSLEQACLIADAAAGDPDAAHGLLDIAGRSSLIGLKRSANRVKALSSCSESSSESARWETLQRRRQLKSWTDVEGLCHRELILLPHEAALFDARLAPFISAAFRAGRGRGAAQLPNRSLVVDGFMGLLESCGKNRKTAVVEVVVVASYEALMRGYATDDELCEIDGLGPIPVSLASELAQDCYLSQVVLRSGSPAIVKGKARYIPHKLKVAVRMRDRCCSVPGCDSTFRCEIDHIVPLFQGGKTTLENLQTLCPSHHRQKTYRDFQMIGRGKNRQWVGPMARAG